MSTTYVIGIKMKKKTNNNNNNHPPPPPQQLMFTPVNPSDIYIYKERER